MSDTLEELLIESWRTDRYGPGFDPAVFAAAAQTAQVLTAAGDYASIASSSSGGVDDALQVPPAPPPRVTPAPPASPRPAPTPTVPTPSAPQPTPAPEIIRPDFAPGDLKREIFEELRQPQKPTIPELIVSAGRSFLTTVAPWLTYLVPTPTAPRDLDELQPFMQPLWPVGDPVPERKPDVRTAVPGPRLVPLRDPRDDPYADPMPEIVIRPAPSPDRIVTVAPDLVSFPIPGIGTDPFGYPIALPGTPTGPQPTERPTRTPVRVAPPRIGTPIGDFPLQFPTPQDFGVPLRVPVPPVRLKPVPVDTTMPAPGFDIGAPFIDTILQVVPEFPDRPIPGRPDTRDAGCACASKTKKNSKKRKPREVCYEGRYEETSTTTRKKRGKEIPCQ